MEVLHDVEPGRVPPLPPPVTMHSMPELPPEPEPLPESAPASPRLTPTPSGFALVVRPPQAIRASIAIRAAVRGRTNAFYTALLR
jgi:hypothetical protein